jgi:hypothetical protein
VQKVVDGTPISSIKFDWPLEVGVFVFRKFAHSQKIFLCMCSALNSGSGDNTFLNQMPIFAMHYQSSKKPRVFNL